MRKGIVFIIGAAVLLSFVIAIVAIAAEQTRQTRVIFLDVGQGDAILITRGTQQVLIDGGADRRVLLEKLGRYMPFWDRTVDVLIATHPDADHIAAQVGVFDAYYVGAVIATDAFKKSRVATAWHSALEKSRARVIMANESVRIHMKKDDEKAGVMRVLFPRVATDVPAIKDVNDTSIVTLLTVGKTTFLMMGDLSQKQERNINPGPVSVLKVGHHGSKTSSSEEFIARVHPHDAIVSVGVHNRYGHPAQDVLARLKKYGAHIIRTDKQGDIVYMCFFEKNDVCERL